MTYVAPSTRVNGDIITATIWNQDVVANSIAHAVISQDAEIIALAGLTSAADSVPYFTGSGAAALATFTAFARTITAAATAAAAQATIGLASTFTPTTDVDVNITAGATNRNVNLTPTGTGRVIPAKAIKLFGETADPVNEQDISYDTGDGLAQAKYKVGRVAIPGTFYRQTADSTAITATSDTAFDQLPSAFTASSLVAGSTIEWTAAYLYSITSGAPSFRLKYKLVGSGTKVIIDTAAYSTVGVTTNRIVVVKGILQIQSTGAAANYRCAVEIAGGLDTTAGKGQVILTGGPSSEFGTVDATIDTTQSPVLTDSFTWGAANGSIKRIAWAVVVY